MDECTGGDPSVVDLATLHQPELDLPRRERLECARRELLLLTERQNLAREEVQLTGVLRGDDDTQILAVAVARDLVGREDLHGVLLRWTSFGGSATSIARLSTYSETTSTFTPSRVARPHPGASRTSGGVPSRDPGGAYRSGRPRPSGVARHPPRGPSPSHPPPRCRARRSPGPARTHRPARAPPARSAAGA